MVSRRPNSKDTVLDRNSNITVSSILKNFAGINFHESPILKNFAGINFRESTFSGIKKGIYFRDFGQNSQNSRNFLPAKISSLKVIPYLLISNTNLWQYYPKSIYMPAAVNSVTEIESFGA